MAKRVVSKKKSSLDNVDFGRDCIHLGVMAFLYIVFLQIQLLYFSELITFDKFIMIFIIGLFILISYKFARIYLKLVHH